ncbi:unnamed protein product [Effrenium voratum]|nr:unnamed protein product [Effrenium voratum]
MGMKRGVVLAIAACAVNAWWHGRSFVFGGFRSIATGSRPASAHRRQAGTGAYITLEELDRAPAVRKRRHKKLQEFQEGKWKVVSDEQPLPEPSEDRSTLGIQLEETQKAERLLTFLESAVRSPAFDARLGARALEQLAEQRPSLQDDELSKLSSQPGLVALVVKTEQQLPCWRR